MPKIDKKCLGCNVCIDENKESIYYDMCIDCFEIEEREILNEKVYADRVS